jgi:hypothetical protein
MADTITDSPQNIPQRYRDIGGGAKAKVIAVGDGKMASAEIGANLTFSAGQVMGGKFELPDIARDDNGSGFFTSAVIGMKINNSAPVDVFIFGREPTNGSYASGAAFTLHASDMPYCLGVYQVNSWFAGVASASIGQAPTEPRFFQCFDPSKKKSLWIIPVARGSIALTAVADAALTMIASRN